MYNTQFFHTVLLFLAAVSGSLTQQLREDLKAGNIIVENQELYIKKEISGGGIVNLITSATETLDGICNFDKNYLEQGRAFVFDRIAINYATDAASGKEGELEYGTKAPAALQNADLLILQEGRVVFTMSVRSLTNIETGQASADEYSQLRALAHFVDKRKIEIQLKFPDGVALSNAAKHYIYVRFNGCQTTKKTNVNS